MASERPGSAPPEDDVPAPGQIIAEKYEVERILGRGGMGVVLGARHLDLGQRVAIKFMRAEVARDASAAERFLREARASVALSSHHVARVFDAGRLESGAPYMVMEYLAGEDLDRVLRRTGPLLIQTAVALVLQACDALAEAHALGIVHRDLKPANLFVSPTKDGTSFVKVLDFGISKAALSADAKEAGSLTGSGVVIGSPGYMSPEQVRSPKDVDARSDIWSLGVILYELLTGVSPFSGETIGDSFAKITSEDPVPLRQLRPEVPAALARVVEGCLQRKLQARIDSVATLASRLVEFAPESSRPVVERIRRLSGAADSESRQATLVAPETFSAIDRTALAVGHGRLETGPAWLRSASSTPRRRTMPTAVVVLGAAGVVGALGLGLWKLGGPHPAESPSRSVASSPLITQGTAAASSPPHAIPLPTAPAEDPGEAQSGAVDAGVPSVPKAPARRPLSRVPSPPRSPIVEPPVPAPALAPKPAPSVESTSHTQPAPKPAPSAKRNELDIY